MRLVHVPVNRDGALRRVGPRRLNAAHDSFAFDTYYFGEGVSIVRALRACDDSFRIRIVPGRNIMQSCDVPSLCGAESCAEQIHTICS